MRYLFLLLLISCSVQNCKVDPNASLQAKTEIKIDSKTVESKTDSKNIIDQIKDFKDNLQPGAQLKCNF